MNKFSWAKLQVKEKISVFALVAIIVTYLLYDLVLEPQWTHMDDLTAQYQAEQQQLKIVEDFVVAHPNPEQHLIELDNKLIQVGSKFPDNPEISSLLVQIEQLSRECGVQLNYLKPTKIANNDKEGYREMDVEFSITGTFAQNMNFLNKTENGLRFANITSIGMQLNKKNLDSKITAKIYTYGVPAAAPVPGTPPVAPPVVKK